MSARVQLPSLVKTYSTIAVATACMINSDVMSPADASSIENGPVSDVTKTMTDRITMFLTGSCEKRLNSRNAMVATVIVISHVKMMLGMPISSASDGRSSGMETRWSRIPYE